MHIILVMFFVDLFRAEALKSFLFVYYFFFSSLFELYIDKKSNQLLNPVFYMIIFTTKVHPGGPDGIPLSVWLHAGRSLVLLSTARTDLHAELQRNMSQTGAHLAVLDLRKWPRLSTMIVDIFSSVVLYIWSVAIHLLSH